MDALCREFLRAIKEFYSDPNNIDIYEKWRQENSDEGSCEQEEQELDAEA